MSPHRISLAQQIAELDEPAPIDIDPEDERHDPSAQFGDAVDAREHYVEVAPSALRHRLDCVIDPKYIGVKTSREQLEEDSTFEDLHSESQCASSEGEDQVLSQAEEEGGDDQEQPPSRLVKDAQENTDHENNFSTTVRQRRDEDRKKGRAVSKQLTLWDSLLDARIRLQKSVTASNQLPPPTQISGLISHRRCLEARHALLGEALTLIDELSVLREDLMKEDGEVQWQPRKRRRVQDGSEQGRRYPFPEIDNVDQDWDALIREASEDATGLEHAYHAHLTRTLAKWSAKVAAVAPSALLPASRKKFSQASSAIGGVKSVGTQIEEMLRSEGTALLSRTRLRRCKGSRVTGGRDSDEAGDDGLGEDVEVFDDTDFYQQLLRDVIDTKGAGQVDWMANQRKRKSKKTVDTKASKGRKLRYQVHEKIQNFMVPVPLSAGAWHEAQIDELFASLLGKGIDNEMSAGPGLQLSGFRIFG